ncbi:MAG: glycosyltransferase family 4 protein [Akkermansiaceae bacterium]|nr:glycosyltransferase family 4 protein [Akkermansiaceae bacterium]
MHLANRLSRMRILITNGALSRRSGTERYAVELAEGLRKRGHEVLLFSPCLGNTAAELQADGFTVTDDLASILETPDMIHGQHVVVSLRAACAFPEAPLLYVCHDGLSRADEPTPGYMTDAYAAVDRFTARRITNTTGVGREAVHLLGNVVDVDRFQQRSTFADTPRKALIYSGSIRTDAHFQLIRKVCIELGLELHEAGERADGFFDQPEEHLHEYDIIFCKARCAMEAMASGAYVILIGDNGMGEEVDLQNIEELRHLNFGREALCLPHSEEFLRKRITSYDAGISKQVSDWVRQNLTPDAWLDKVESTYQTVVAKPSIRLGIRNFPEGSPTEFRGWKLQFHGKSHQMECVKMKGTQVKLSKILRECNRIWHQMKSSMGKISERSK